MRALKPAPTQPGFTLIELLMTVALMAILLSIAAPSMGDLVRDNRASSQTNQLVTTLNLARSEAVKRGAIVTVCRSTDSQSCDEDADWSTGWIVFQDANQAPGGAPVLGSADDVLRAWGSLGESTILRRMNNQPVRFNPRGAISHGNEINFELCINDCDGSYDREIAVRPSGQIKSSRRE